MKFIIIIYTTNKLTIVEMEDIIGVRLRKFKLRKIILGVRMHFRHILCINRGLFQNQFVTHDRPRIWLIEK